MAYFSNGTEGDLYLEAVCMKCANYPADDATRDCPIRAVHFFYNYDQHKNPEVKGILNILIPRTKDGGNAQCSMFRPLPLRVVR